MTAQLNQHPFNVPHCQTASAVLQNTPPSQTHPDFQILLTSKSFSGCSRCPAAGEGRALLQLRPSPDPPHPADRRFPQPGAVPEPRGHRRAGQRRGGDGDFSLEKGMPPVESSYRQREGILETQDYQMKWSLHFKATKSSCKQLKPERSDAAKNPCIYQSRFKLLSELKDLIAV